MGIFSSKSEKPRKPSGKTIIAEGCKLSGEMIELAGDLHVDGEVEGVVHTEFDISIGEQGIISGLVKANQIAISGTVEGKISCERVDVLDGGRLLGNVICNAMMIEAGGKFIGESREMTDGDLVIGFPELDAFAKPVVEEQVPAKIESAKADSIDAVEKEELSNKS